MIGLGLIIVMDARLVIGLGGDDCDGCEVGDWFVVDACDGCGVGRQVWG